MARDAWQRMHGTGHWPTARLLRVPSWPAAPLLAQLAQCISVLTSPQIIPLPRPGHASNEHLCTRTAILQARPGDTPAPLSRFLARVGCASAQQRRSVPSTAHKTASARPAMRLPSSLLACSIPHALARLLLRRRWMPFWTWTTQILCSSRSTLCGAEGCAWSWSFSPVGYQPLMHTPLQELPPVPSSRSWVASACASRCLPRPPLWRHLPGHPGCQSAVAYVTCVLI